MTAGQEWWCEAYGPPEDGVPAEEWPRCFFAQNDEPWRCRELTVCTRRMGAERRRVFEVIQEGAATGDETMAYLAEQFTSPDQLLNANRDDT